MTRLFVFVTAMGISTLVDAGLENQAKPQLVVALKNSGIQFGTDAGTTTYPNAGLNTTPTKNTGNEEQTVNPNDPATKPYAAPLLSPPPSFSTPPAMKPPSNQSGKTQLPIQ